MVNSVEYNTLRHESQANFDAMRNFLVKENVTFGIPFKYFAHGRYSEYFSSLSSWHIASYSKFGVHEYWMADEEKATVEVWRRRGKKLALHAVLDKKQTLTTPLLPGLRI
jgi:hypothetical protein